MTVLFETGINPHFCFSFLFTHFPPRGNSRQGEDVQTLLSVFVSGKWYLNECDQSNCFCKTPYFESIIDRRIFSLLTTIKHLYFSPCIHNKVRDYSCKARGSNDSLNRAAVSLIVSRQASISQLLSNISVTSKLPGHYCLSHF